VPLACARKIYKLIIQLKDKFKKGLKVPIN